MKYKRISLLLYLILCANIFAGIQHDISQFWLKPDKEQTIEIPRLQETKYLLINYNGELIKTGTFSPDEKGVVKLKLKLPRGYYFLELENSSEILGIAVITQFKGKRDPFFCIDSAMSWLEATPQKKKYRESLIKILRDYGISASRERIWWGDINPASKKWNFVGGRRDYNEIRRLLKKYDISCLDLYQEAPKWTGAGNRYAGENPYPVKLEAVVTAWDLMSKQWGDNWCGWEIWNEPNIGFGNYLPADQYMSLVKTVAYAARKSGWNKALIGGVFSIEYISDFQNQCAENGMLNYINTLSYHSYNSAMSMENAIADYRKWLKKYGHKNMPIWLTENGFSFATGKKRKALKNELKSSALNIAMKTVEAKACGIERNFPFVFSAYAEGAASFSLFYKNYSPMPQLCAYFTVIRLLSGKKYIGDFVTNNKSIKRARIFTDNSDRITAVLYTGKTDFKIKFHLPFDYRAYDIDGREIEVKDGMIEISSGMVYISVDKKVLQARINKNTRALRLAKSTGKANLQDYSGGDGIIISAIHNMKIIYKHTPAGYYITQEKAQNFSINFNVSNLTKQAEKSIFHFDVCDPDGKLLLKIIKTKLSLLAHKNILVKGSFKMGDLLKKYGALKLKAYINPKNPVICQYILQKTLTADSTPENEALKWYDFTGQKYWLSTGELWYGRDDFSVKFSSSWNSKFLTFYIDVKDNIHHQPFMPKNMWRGDSVQLALQCLRDNNHPIPKKTTQWCLGIKDGNPIVFADRILPGITREKTIKSLELSYKRDGIIRYIAKIFPEALGLRKFTSKQILGFSILVNDNDSYGRKGAFCWGDGIAKYNGNTLTYNKLKLLGRVSGNNNIKQHEKVK